MTALSSTCASREGLQADNRFRINCLQCGSFAPTGQATFSQRNTSRLARAAGPRALRHSLYCAHSSNNITFGYRTNTNFLPFAFRDIMPCLDPHHKHRPWPTSGRSIVRIEACERSCGWCSYKAKAANNLRAVSLCNQCVDLGANIAQACTSSCQESSRDSSPSDQD